MSNVAGGKWIRPEKRLAIYLRDDFTCQWCGLCLKDADARLVTLDHVIPRSKGGCNSQSNLITACLTCNSTRRDESMVTFAAKQGVSVESIMLQVEKPINVALAKAIRNGGI